MTKKQDKDEIININHFLYEGHGQVCGGTFADSNSNISKSKSLNLRKNRDLVGHSYLS